MENREIVLLIIISFSIIFVTENTWLWNSCTLCMGFWPTNLVFILDACLACCVLIILSLLIVFSGLLNDSNVLKFLIEHATFVYFTHFTQGMVSSIFLLKNSIWSQFFIRLLSWCVVLVEFM